MWCHDLYVVKITWGPYVEEVDHWDLPWNDVSCPLPPSQFTLLPGCHEMSSCAPTLFAVLSPQPRNNGASQPQIEICEKKSLN